MFTCMYNSRMSYVVLPFPYIWRLKMNDKRCTTIKFTPMNFSI